MRLNTTTLADYIDLKVKILKKEYKNLGFTKKQSKELLAMELKKDIVAFNSGFTSTSVFLIIILIIIIIISIII